MILFIIGLFAHTAHLNKISSRFLFHFSQIGTQRGIYFGGGLIFKCALLSLTNVSFWNRGMQHNKFKFFKRTHGLLKPFLVFGSKDFLGFVACQLIMEFEA